MLLHSLIVALWFLWASWADAPPSLPGLEIAAIHQGSELGQIEAWARAGCCRGTCITMQGMERRKRTRYKSEMLSLVLEASLQLPSLLSIRKVHSGAAFSLY